MGRKMKRASRLLCAPASVVRGLESLAGVVVGVAGVDVLVVVDVEVVEVVPYDPDHKQYLSL